MVRNRRRTLILSNAEAYPRAVLSPNRSVPIPGVVIKELILLGYSLSLCALVGLYASLTCIVDNTTLLSSRREPWICNQVCASHQTSNIRVAWYITEDVVESIILVLVTTIEDRIRGRGQWREVVNQIVSLSCCVRYVNDVSSVRTDNCNTIFSCISKRDDVVCFCLRIRLTCATRSHDQVINFNLIFVGEETVGSDQIRKFCLESFVAE